MTVFAVTPVVDYEPPRRDVPPCRQPSHAALRRRARASPRGCPAPPDRPVGAPAAAPAAASAPMRQAAVFADAALRRVLEVIDRRRPAAQLRPLLAPGLVDSVVSLGRGPAGQARAAAVLRRTRLQPAGHRDPGSAAEVFGSFSRGERVHAIACRVERVRTGAGRARWLVVALHIG
ncbi:hypothetical protein A5672_13630 [Mycobacterium alsense]|uniref:Alanine, arginine and proline rich protein n=1 Tax=Mycobacterium alsense TaxID=324058 RepID=A0ABD6P2K8_9MYCO|nr:Rv3235 family protein [Mycobacterium alsense]OBG40707.1 hypothetical protein A5672_13630 [Mycobacterium alsense]